MNKHRITSFLLALVIFLSAGSSITSFAKRHESSIKIITTDKSADREDLARRISQSAGAEILCVYKNFDMIAVKLDSADVSKLYGFKEIKHISPVRSYKPASEGEETDIQEEISEDITAEKTVWTVRDTIISEYKGEGMVAAVIDSSFDTGHYTFALSNDETARLTLDDIDSLFGELNASEDLESAEDIYVSAKIPFAFDYGEGDTDLEAVNLEHGTHVAGIIAGNNTEGNESGFWGIAPEAQIVMMKIMDSDGYLQNYCIYEALDDAMTLGVDSVNLSLGYVSGFAEDADPDVSFSTALAAMRKAGINVYFSAGNESHTGTNSGYDLNYSISDSPAFAPDYSTIGAEATYSDVMAVASAIPEKRMTANHIVLNDGSYIDFEEDSNYTFIDTFKGKKLLFAAVPGIGAPEDFEGINVSGKIAVIQRGEITFTEKVANAQQRGAIGVIIYDNVESSVYVSMLVEAGLIPACFILKSDAEILLASESKRISIEQKNIISDSPEYGLMSDFSSWGPNGQLELKPDITGYGSDIYSAIAGDKTGNMSGTSMSCPYITGISLLVRQMLIETEADYSEIDGIDNIGDRVNVMMMNSAEILHDGYCFISPRSQGAGLAIADYALMSYTELIDPETKKAKLSLGDNLGAEFEIKVQLINTSDTDRDYYVGAYVMTEDYYYSEDAGEGFCAGYDYCLENAKVTIGKEKTDYNLANERYSADPIKVPAMSSTDLTFNVKLSKLEMVEFEKIYKNGYFIEGYVFALESVDEGEFPDKASLPFLGFSGDWDALPMFDCTGNFMTTSLYTTVYFGEEILYYELNESLFDENFIDPRFLYVSPNNDGINDDLMVNIQLLRNARHLVIEMFNEDGEQLLSDTWEYVTKVGTDIDGNLIYDNSALYYLVDSDNYNYIYPDGRYRVVIKASPESAPDLFQSYELEFVIDTEKPVLEYSKIEREDGAEYLTVKVSDDNLISLISLYEGEPEDDKYTPYAEDILLSSDELGQSFEYTFDITDIESEHIYLDIYDASYNIRTVRIELN